MIALSEFHGDQMPFVRERPSFEIDKWLKDRTKVLGRALDGARASKGSAPLTARLHEFQKLISKVSMHLGEEFSIGLNDKLVSLLDVEKWEEDDVLPSVASFKTFYRALVVLQTQKRPGMGVSVDGSMVAAWTSGMNRLTIEFKENDSVQWVLSRTDSNNRKEKAAGISTVSRLPAVLAPYSTEIWFENA